MAFPKGSVDLDLSLCAELMPALLAGGFTPTTVRSLAAAPTLIRRVLSMASAHVDPDGELQALIDPMDPTCPLFKVPVSPLDLTPREWLSYVEERNRGADIRRCDVQTGEAFFGHAEFEARPDAQPSQLLLLETANGQRAMGRIEASALQIAPDCAGCTKPQAIFEVLRQVWGRLNDINAAYVMLPSLAMASGAPMPVIINPPQGNIRLGWINHIPKSHGYTGYVAFMSR